MKSSNITFTILLLFSILSFSILSISSTNVNAVIDVNTYTTSKDFTLSTPYDEVNICACSAKYDTFTVTNTATWPSIYSVSLSKTDSTISLTEQSFELYPGYSKEVFLYINADCNKGNEDVKVIVTSNLGVSKALDKTIVKDRCQNIEMVLADYKSDVNPCTPKTFEILLHNVGPFTDTYELSSNYDQYNTNDNKQISYSANVFNLEPNQYAKVLATTNFDCSVYGEQNIQFTAKSLNNRLTASVDAKLNILRSYDFNVRIGYDYSKLNYEVVDQDVCNRQSSTKIPVVITNTGSVENTYFIDYDLPKNAKLTGLDVETDKDSKDEYKNTFTLKSKETRILYVDVDSTNYRSQEKTKKAEIEISTLYGDVSKEFLIKLNYKPCFEHDVKIYDYSNNKFSPLDTCANYDYSYEINVVNNGLFKEDYFLSLENSPSTIALSTDRIIGLEPGKNAIVNLYIKGPEDNDKHNVVVKVVSSSKMIEYDNTWIQAYDTISCHNTEILSNDFDVNYQDSQISIPIKNIGIENNAYIVDFDGSNIVDKTDLLLQLNSGDKGYVTAVIDSEDKAEGIYNGTLTLKDSSGATYSRFIEVELEDKSLVRKAFEYFAFNNLCRQATLAELLAIPLLILLIAVFKITSPKYQYNFKNRLKSKIWIIIGLIALFLVGVIVVVTVVGLPQSQSEVYNLSTDETTLTYEWLENDKYVLDAGKFFYDPDNTSLKYTVNGITNIKAVISGKMITFYPDNGWSGTEKAEITATDNFGGSVTSPEFTLKVLDTPKKSYLQLYNIYCWYVNLLIYLALLFLVFIAAFVKQEVRRKK